MRTANLILHRKVDSKAECICGSKMDYVDGKGFVCKRQIRNEEPNIIQVEEQKIFELFTQINSIN